MGCASTKTRYQERAESLLSVPAAPVAQENQPRGEGARRVPDWGEVITEEHLKGLPPVVQTYLRQTGILGKPMARTVTLRQSGAIRQGPDKPWMPLQAVQAYNAETREFVWFAHVRMKGPLSFKGLDSLQQGRGAMTIKLLDLFKVVDARGPKIDQGSRMRFLNEMIWFPSSFLHPAVRWEAVGPRQARVFLDFTDIPGQVQEEAVISFNEEGLPANFSAIRYRDRGKDEAVLTPWETPITAYGVYNGLHLPREGRALWRIPATESTGGTGETNGGEEEQEFIYIKLRIESINPAAEVPKQL